MFEKDQRKKTHPGKSFERGQAKKKRDLPQIRHGLERKKKQLTCGEGENGIRGGEKILPESATTTIKNRSSRQTGKEGSDH